MILVNVTSHTDGNILDILLTNQPGIIGKLSIEPDQIYWYVTFKIKKCVDRNVKIKVQWSNWEEMSNELNKNKFF